MFNASYFKVSALPQSCNKGFQTTVKPFNVWQWLKVQKVVIRLNNFAHLLVIK